jgi:hypothetical protein
VAARFLARLGQCFVEGCSDRVEWIPDHVYEFLVQLDLSLQRGQKARVADNLVCSGSRLAVTDYF